MSQQQTLDVQSVTSYEQQPGGIPLRIDGVSKTFSGRTQTVEALLAVNLEVAAGEFVCLLGPSGCGKSTLLSIIAGLETATTGTVWANGREVRGPGTDRVLLFQEAALFPWLDVQHNVEFGLRQAGVSARERTTLAQHFIELVHLKGFERSYRLHAELEAIWATTYKTVLFVTHNVREAVALGDRVLVFSPRPGRIVGEFRINLPRPRSLEDHTLVDKAAEILTVLKGIPSDKSGEYRW